MQIIDAHCHYWRLDRGDYDWLDQNDAALAPICRDFIPADYPADARMIVVQAAATQAETDYLLSLAQDNPRIAGVVGWADLTDPATPDWLTQRAANPVFKGIRPMLQDIFQTDWLLNRPHPAALAALGHLGLRFDALVTTRHLPMLAEFARRNPDLPLVIDHAAKPKPSARDDWRRGLRDLAAIPHVQCKLSGLMTELSPEERKAPLPSMRAIVDELLDWFGPDRLIWGSDWPVLTLATSYAEWLDLTAKLLADLTEGERAAIMGGNAERFYGTGP